MENKLREELINKQVDKYFVETKNPILKHIKKVLGEPISKEEMKNKLKEQKFGDGF